MDAIQKLLMCSVLIGVAGIATTPLAQAQSTGMTLAAIETAYKDYERIEVSFGPTQVKVEAIDADTGQSIEAIYDRMSGEILKQETSTVAGPVGAGVEVKNRDEDFIRTGLSGGDDEETDHVSDDHQKAGDDDGVDDSTGADDDDGSQGSGQDANDDHGGNSGSDGHGGDRADNGGSYDDDGSDDDGDDD